MIDQESIAKIVRDHWNPEGCSWCHDEGMKDALPCCREAATVGKHPEHIAALITAAS